MDQGLKPGAAGEGDRTAKALQFARVFETFGASRLVADLETRVETIEIDGITVPLTVTDGIDRNSYLVRPTTAYIDYAIDETRNFAHMPALRTMLSAGVAACRPLMRATGLDRQVQVNNWLLSTNPAPVLDRPAALRLTEGLVERFPGHAVVMRSLNEICDAGTMSALVSAGWLLLPARQVYILDPSSRLGRDARRDDTLLKQSDFRVEAADGFDDADFERCERLYAMLYLEKYTPLNPHYSALYLREMHKAGIIELTSLRNMETGVIEGVSGLFQYGDVLTNPIVGYHTRLPEALGLYRRLIAHAARRARAGNLRFNMSAGAAGFKRNRGAGPAIEYTAVHVRHLRPRNRMATAAAAAILRTAGIPLLRRFEL